MIHLGLLSSTIDDLRVRRVPRRSLRPCHVQNIIGAKFNDSFTILLAVLTVQRLSSFNQLGGGRKSDGDERAE